MAAKIAVTQVFGGNAKLVMFETERLPTFSHGYYWEISGVTGSLLRFHERSKEKKIKSKEIVSALELVNNPFSCYKPKAIDFDVPQCLKDDLNVMHNRLLKISSSRFMTSLIYANIRREIFDTTEQAFSVISKIDSQTKNRDKLCLQRSLLAAKTSKSFKDKGVLFVGAQIPTKDMHAWIIEDGGQPDYEDRNWVNFRPLLAVRFK
jgi:hypothetical protein